MVLSSPCVYQCPTLCVMPGGFEVCISMESLLLSKMCALPLFFPVSIPDLFLHWPAFGSGALSLHSVQDPEVAVVRREAWTLTPWAWGWIQPAHLAPPADMSKSHGCHLLSTPVCWLQAHLTSGSHHNHPVLLQMDKQKVDTHFVLRALGWWDWLWIQGFSMVLFRGGVRQGEVFFRVRPRQCTVGVAVGLQFSLWGKFYCHLFDHWEFIRKKV